LKTELQGTITTKITLLIIISVVVATSIIGSVFYFEGRSMFLSKSKVSVQSRIQEAKSGIVNYYKTVKIDLEFLSFIDNQGNSELEVIYQKLHKFYYHDFYVFKDSSDLLRSEFFNDKVSLKNSIVNFDTLAVNNFLISNIHKYSSKFAHQWAVYKANNSFYVIQLNFLNLLNVFVRSLENYDNLIILNSKGEYLYSPFTAKNFLFEKKINSTFYRDFYGSEKYFKNKSSFNLEGRIYAEDYLFVFDYLDLKEFNIKLYMGIGLNLDRHLYSLDLVRSKTFVYTSVMLIITLILGAFFTKFITKGLKTITKAAQEYTAGNTNVDLSAISGRDEIGVLAITLQGMIRQLNERNRLQSKQEKELRMARDQAENALKEKSFLLENLNNQKNMLEDLTKEKDELLAIVSHDLKNPLSVIDASMDLVKEDKKTILSKISNDLIARSKNSAKISLSLITDLLDLARYEGGIKLEYSKFNLYELIMRSVDVFTFKLEEKKINLEINVSKDFILNADFSRISQVVTNIVGNSIKYTPQNGTISINAELESKTLVLHFIDNGAGIPEGAIDKIFEKFSQGRKSDRAIGTGLGLAICKKICDMHNGEITVTSKLGEWTNFVVKIPGLSYVEGKEILDISSASTNKTILLVEDDDDIRQMINEILVDNDFLVLKSRSSKEAVYLAETNKFDFIITDYRLGDEDGLSLIKKLRKVTIVPSVVMSGNVNTIPKDMMLENGIIKFFVKPFKLTLLPDVINAELKINNEIDILSSIHKEDTFENQGTENNMTKKILFVDDSEDIRNIVQLFLKNTNDLELTFAINGEEAYEKVKINNYDMLFMDENMPILSGSEAMLKIKNEKLQRKTIFVAMSANNSEEDQKKYIEHGFKYSIGKPITKAKILEYLKMIDQNKVKEIV